MQLFQPVMGKDKNPRPEQQQAVVQQRAPQKEFFE